MPKTKRLKNIIILAICAVVTSNVSAFSYTDAHFYSLEKKAVNSLNKKNYYNAEKFANKAINIYPYGHESLYVKGKVEYQKYLKNKNYDTLRKSINYAKKSLDVKKNYMPALQLLKAGYKDLEDRDGYQGALFALIDLQPKNADNYYELGCFYYKDKQYLKAERLFNSSIEQKKQTKTYLLQGKLYQKLGDTKRAKLAYKNVLKKDKKNQEAKRMITFLESL